MDLNIPNFMKNSQKQLLFIGFALLIVSSVVLALMMEKTPGEVIPFATKPALIVNTTSPKIAIWPVILEANGNIAPWQEAIVSAEISGLKLTAVNVHTGEFVHKDQVLAHLSKDTLSQELAQQNAGVDEAEAVLAEFKADANRARSMQKPGSPPDQKTSQLFIAERSAEAKLAAAKARRTATQLQLDLTQVKAPDDGIISASTATLGAVVANGQELFRLIRKNRLEWRAQIMAADLAKINLAGEVSVKLSGQKPIKGTVRMIAPTVDPNTRIALVYVDINAPTEVKAGMFASGEFLLGKTNALTVPQQAVVIRDGFSYVFAVTKDHRVKQLKVQVGRYFDEHIEILQGLSEVNSIVVSGAGFLNDGDLVSIQAQAVNAQTSDKL